MKCPNCKGNLIQIDFKGVKVDECKNCKGKWFDRDELRKAKDSTDDDLRWLDFDLFDDNSDKYNIASSERKCPKDNSKMVSLTYRNSQVIIDKCSTCKGSFLDNKEFEKIVKYLGHIVISTPASEYKKETLKEFSEIFNGPESTLSEIKDFMSVVNLFSLRLKVENPWTIALSENINKYWPFR